MFALSDLRESSGDNKKMRFMELLISSWDKLHTKSDNFRYKIDNMRERIVNGKYLLQLNPDRSTKRRTPDQIDNICQPFDKNKFNFTKVSPEEILFTLANENDDADLHAVLVNVSPISQYHSLLCPSVYKCLPQIITLESLQLALDIFFLAQDWNLRIGFNSLCALASVNHLHYHLFIEDNTFAVENVKCKQINGHLHCFEDYPVPAFCFEVDRNSISVMAKEINKLLNYFLDNSIAHNIFITKGSKISSASDSLMENHPGVTRVIIFPRRSTSGVKQLTAFNIAVCELSGWFPVYSVEDFNTLEAEELENEMKKWAIHDFEKLCEHVKVLY